MPSVADPSVPVRSGVCRLQLFINGHAYSLKRGPAVKKGAKVWRMRSLSGPRAGACYSVVSFRRQVSCTCPDDARNQAVCKHVRALQALQLVNPRAIPSAVFVAATIAGAKGVAHV